MYFCMCWERTRWMFKDINCNAYCSDISIQNHNIINFMYLLSNCNKFCCIEMYNEKACHALKKWTTWTGTVNWSEIQTTPVKLEWSDTLWTYDMDIITFAIYWMSDISMKSWNIEYIMQTVKRAQSILYRLYHTLSSEKHITSNYMLWWVWNS